MKKIKIDIKILLICIIIAICTFFAVLDFFISPIIVRNAQVEINSIISKTTGEAVLQVVSDTVNYNDLISIKENEKGEITLIQANTQKMNIIATQIALIVENTLDNDIYNQPIVIPFGSVFGSQLFANTGPNVGVSIKAVGNVTTEFISEFESAGINQTKHKMFLNLTTKVSVLVPNNNQDIEVVVKIPIAETIIVGNVPTNIFNMENGETGLNLVPKQ